MFDTSPDLEKRYREMLLSCSPAERLRMVGRMYDCGKRLAVTGIVAQDKNISENEIRTELFLRFYGNDFTHEQCKRIVSRITR